MNGKTFKKSLLTVLFLVIGAVGVIGLSCAFGDSTFRLSTTVLAQCPDIPFNPPYCIASGDYGHKENSRFKYYSTCTNCPGKRLPLCRDASYQYFCPGLCLLGCKDLPS